MSVLGLDFGNLNSVIAVAQRGGVDILANEASARLTASLVSFGETQRYTGEGAAAVQMSNLKNTVGNLKRLLGRKWSDPELQAELPMIGVCNEFVELPGDKVGVKVTYRGEPHVFSPEQLASMVLAKLKETTEHETSTKVSDVVVSVPGYFHEAQRRALLDAIKLAGMNTLRILNDLTALSLCWGLYKTDLDEKEPKRVMIIDVGDQAASIGITEFTKSQSKIISTAYDRRVSGAAIDFALATHFAAEFQEKRKIDLRTIPKSWFRLLSAVSKVKKILNANPTAPLNIECIYEEYDINSVISKDVYAELIKEVVASVPGPVQVALDRAKLTTTDLHSIEIVGSASRTIPIQLALTAFLGRDLSFTLNAEEALAKGCALQCAILSPHFRVREYHLVDIVDYPVDCTWNTINDPSDTVEKHINILNRTSTWPVAKNVKFNRAQSKPFAVKIHYDNSPDAPKGTDSVLATVTVPHVPVPADGGDAEIHLKIRKNTNGTIDAVDCELVEKYEEAEAAPVPAASPVPAPAGETPAAAAPMEVDAEAPKKKIRKTAVPFEVKHTYGATKAQLEEWSKLEQKIAEETRLAVNVANAKNAVEAYVYDARYRLCETWAPYATDEERDSFNALLDETGDWLYGEGEDQTKEVYELRLLSMRARGDPLASRLSEDEARPTATANFQRAMEDYTARVADTSDKYEHIPAEEKAKITAEIEKARSWFNPLSERQANAPKSEDPVFLVRDVQNKIDALTKMAEPILNKPKPKPKPAPATETKMDTDKPATDGTPAPESSPAPEAKMETDKPTETTPATDSKPVPDMEVD